MKLKAFRIKNFRSIIDSGWKNLANDNITALIGQNESGKTSVLEALNSFYAGNISDDILRSDLTFPEVYCQFELQNDNLLSLLNPRLLPDELVDILEKKKQIIIGRKWFEDRKSILITGDEDIMNYYEEKTRKKEEIEERTRQEIDNLLNKADNIFKEMESAENDKLEAQNDLNESHVNLEVAKKTLKKARKPDARLIAERQLETAEKDYQQKESEFNVKVQQFETIREKTQKISEKVSVCRLCNESGKEMEGAKKVLDDCSSAMKDAEHFFDMCISEKEKKFALGRLEQARDDYATAQKNYKTLKEKVGYQRAIAANVFDGSSYKMAEAAVQKDDDNEKSHYSAEDIGSIIFKNIPVFDFFEDFSSLLPNKIDLEDVLTGNMQAEGYKAAQNFLIVSGLTPEFFREKNHRILKQKIENLNGTITINFQDYWRQNVGKNNKIRLNFELEHYDYTVPEKSGKPYLEFWIKDKQERLYPNQRSRGVRWFLSFYLELKATAKKNTINRILLIDEPGLSLHARAQEDVLKVFEDLKEEMQIIYCTHSPYLVDVNKLYRILAVERANEEDEQSETLLRDIHSLHSASSDTLSPVYSLMGLRLNDQQFIRKENNIIIEDAIVYYYLNAMFRLLSPERELHFMPATGLSNIPALTNILTGWKLGYIVMLFDNQQSKSVIDVLAGSLFSAFPEQVKEKILVIDGVVSIEDLFSTIDFKKWLLNDRVGITESNYEYIENNNLSRTVLASNFVNAAQSGKIKPGDLDNDTKNNFQRLLENIDQHLKKQIT